MRWGMWGLCGALVGRWRLSTAKEIAATAFLHAGDAMSKCSRSEPPSCTLRHAAGCDHHLPFPILLLCAVLLVCPEHWGWLSQWLFLLEYDEVWAGNTCERFWRWSFQKLAMLEICQGFRNLNIGSVLEGALPAPSVRGFSSQRPLQPAFLMSSPDLCIFSCTPENVWSLGLRLSAQKIAHHNSLVQMRWKLVEVFSVASWGK